MLPIVTKNQRAFGKIEWKSLKSNKTLIKKNKIHLIFCKKLWQPCKNIIATTSISLTLQFNQENDGKFNTIAISSVMMMKTGQNRSLLTTISTNWWWRKLFSRKLLKNNFRRYYNSINHLRTQESVEIENEDKFKTGVKLKIWIDLMKNICFNL